MDRDIIISIKTVAFIILMLLGVYVLWKLGTIIIILWVSTLIVISLEHSVRFFQAQTLLNKPLSRGVAVLTVYFLLIIAIALAFTIVLPPVIAQAQKLIVNIAGNFSGLSIFENYETSSTLLPSIADVTTEVINTTFSVFTTIFTVISVLIISIYMSIDWENIKRRALSLFNHEKVKNEASKTINEIETSIGYWIKGQFTLMVSVGFMSTVGLAILNVEYALALGVAAGLLEIVPVLGPIIALVLAGIIGFSHSVGKGLAVVALFTVIQQLENNVLVPKVMHRVSGFSPLVILVALLVGAALFGIIGAIIAVPTMMIGVIITKHVLRFEK